MFWSNVIIKFILLFFKENVLKVYYVNENGFFDCEVWLFKWRKFEKRIVDNVSICLLDKLSES